MFCIKPAAMADHPRRPRNHLEAKLLWAEVYTRIACIDFFRDYSAPISHLWVSKRLKSIQAQRNPPHLQTIFSSVSDKRAAGGAGICLGGAVQSWVESSSQRALRWERGLMGRERCAKHDANTKAVCTTAALLKSGYCFCGDPIATIQNFKAFFQWENINKYRAYKFVSYQPLAVRSALPAISNERQFGIVVFVLPSP